jgi:putative choline binding protein A
MNCCLNSKGETIMENQNILTIKFNTLDDLAVQVADWNERLNHQCQGQCMSEKPTVKVTLGNSLELTENKLEDTFKKAIEKSSKKIVEGINQLEANGCKVKILENEVSAHADDVPVTDFEGNPTKLNKEEKIKPAETTKVEEQTPIETPKQDTELDVAAETVDKKAFYKEFREWMGEDGVKAKKALAIFSKHGVTRPSSDSLTDDLITDLKSIMAEEA